MKRKIKPYNLRRASFNKEQNMVTTLDFTPGRKIYRDIKNFRSCTFNQGKSS